MMPMILSLVKRLSLSKRSINTLKYLHGVESFVLSSLQSHLYLRGSLIGGSPTVLNFVC